MTGLKKKAGRKALRREKSSKNDELLIFSGRNTRTVTKASLGQIHQLRCSNYSP